jgi:uncharacterized protein (DUF1778 family)
MGTKLKTVSVRLDARASARVERAARLLRQSKGAFLARAGEEAAQRVLLEWAAQRYEAEAASLSELAAETGLPLEAIAQEVTRQRGEDATEHYLASCRKLSETLRMPEFYAGARRAIEVLTQEAASARP